MDLTHQAELGTGHYLLTGWSAGANGTFARLTYDRTFQIPDCPGCAAIQQSTFTLRQVTG